MGNIVSEFFKNKDIFIFVVIFYYLVKVFIYRMYLINVIGCWKKYKINNSRIKGNKKVELYWKI